MSKEYDNTNRGSIWKNDKKETESHPDFTGSLNVAGTEYWVSAWKRKPDASEKSPALSFSVKPKDAPARGGGGGKARPQARNDDFGDDGDAIPFITNATRW